MSIETSFITVYGVQTEYNNEFNDAVYEDQLNRPYEIHRLPFFVQDSMNGEYTIFGHKIMSTGGFSPSEFEMIDIEDLAFYKERYIECFKEIFPDFADILDQSWKIITFVHYS
jgi:hypothetical protein